MPKQNPDLSMYLQPNTIFKNLIVTVKRITIYTKTRLGSSYSISGYTACLRSISNTLQINPARDSKVVFVQITNHLFMIDNYNQKFFFKNRCLIYKNKDITQHNVHNCYMFTLFVSITLMYPNSIMNMLRGGGVDLMSSFRSGSTTTTMKSVLEQKRRPVLASVVTLFSVLVLLSFGGVATAAESSFASSSNLVVTTFESDYSYGSPSMMTVWNSDVTADIHKISTTNDNTAATMSKRVCSDRAPASITLDTTPSITLDTTPPVFTMQPSNIMHDVAPVNIEYDVPSATDDTDSQVDVSCAPSPMTPFGDVTSHEISCTATDDAGNTAMISFLIAISVDITAPMVIAPADIIVDATGLLTTVDLGDASATDNVDDTLTITSDYPSDGFAVGEHTVTWSAVDHSGNVGTATQTVTIQDNTAPEIVFTTSSNVSVLLNGDFTYSDTSCMDDTKDGEFAATRSGDQVDTNTMGVYEVIYTCTDDFGNSVSATQTVTVIDTDNPIVNAPADVTIEATGQLTLVTSGEIGIIIGNAIGIGTATATDSVDGVLTPTLDVSEDGLGLGEHIVTWKVIDSSGNTGSATQNVTIVDTTSPTVVTPIGIVLEATAPLTIVPT